MFFYFTFVDYLGGVRRGNGVGGPLLPLLRGVLPAEQQSRRIPFPPTAASDPKLMGRLDMIFCRNYYRRDAEGDELESKEQEEERSSLERGCRPALPSVIMEMLVQWRQTASCFTQKPG